MHHAEKHSQTDLSLLCNRGGDGISVLPPSCFGSQLPCFITNKTAAVSDAHQSSLSCSHANIRCILTGSSSPLPPESHDASTVPRWDFILTLTTANIRPSFAHPSILTSLLLHFSCRAFAELNHNESVTEVLVNILDRSLEAATVKLQRNNKWLFSFYLSLNLYQPLLLLPHLLPLFLSPTVRLLFLEVGVNHLLPAVTLGCFFCLQIFD